MPENRDSERTGRSTADNGRERVTVDVALDDASEWTVDERIYGKFTEMNAKEGYPGIYSEYLANGSFEEWYIWPKRTPEENPPWWQRSEVLYRDTEPHLGVAYPWEPVVPGASRVTFEHGVGGVHGRGSSGRNRTDVHGRSYQEPERRYQRLTVWDGAAGVQQRLALPDERTLDYVLQVSVRGDSEECVVQIEGPNGDVYAYEAVPVADEWTRHDVSLELDQKSDERYRESTFGEFTLTFVVEERGHLDLDWAMLRAGDAVADKFNPTTIDNVREYGVPSIRWPGGNFTSQYHWNDGVGPIENRPVRSELHWGGLEPNYLGTNEFLEFCEHAGVEPYLNIGFSHELTPEAAANWMEYVNGDPEETELGALRAEHGYKEPWDVETWQVGNEVWGTFQIGHTNATDYGRQYREYYDAMKEVDPDITVFAVGLDPGMETWGGDTWNEALFEEANNRIEGVDVHRYVHGESGDRDRDPVEFNQQLVLFPAQFEENVRELRAMAADYGLDDLLIDVGEWNMGAGGLDKGPRARYGTQAHAAFCAGMYNAFLRQGEAVRFAYQRDNAFKHRPYSTDFRPVWTANNAVLALYTEPFEMDAEWHHVLTTVDGPTGDIDRHGENIEPMSGVSFVDVAAIRTGNGGATRVYTTNRNLAETFRATFDLGLDTGAMVHAVIQSAEDPLDDRTDWDGETSYEREETTLTADTDGRIALDLPPAAVVRLDVDPSRE